MTGDDAVSEGVEATDGEELEGTEPLSIANEYAQVHLRKVFTRNGERLELRSERAGHSILLDPIELEAISGWSHAEISSVMSKKLES